MRHLDPIPLALILLLSLGMALPSGATSTEPLQPAPAPSPTLDCAEAGRNLCAECGGDSIQCCLTSCKVINKPPKPDPLPGFSPGRPTSPPPPWMTWEIM